METRGTLLMRIRDPNDGQAWSDFVSLYAPLLHAYAVKCGLQDADAADIAQETLRHVLRTAPGFVYDPARGSFRGWLLTIARNEVRKFTGRAARRTTGTGDTEARLLLEAVPDREPDPGEWERDYQLHLFHWAADRVRPEFRENTWQAFWRTVVGGQNVDTVARDLGLTRGAVYIARSRVTARVRDEIRAAGED
ncbi:MAG TPA: sigma-70 family RNA polymerase sigma factor [Gemmataceae bacterium]|nr:sigma-70 family RNA polymerase sigma factor [Gemmataceae bacterium]